MALILDTDLLCVERGGQSYKWTGAELKNQIETLAPVDFITGIDPIVVTNIDREVEISIEDGTLSQKGAVILTSTVDDSEDKALTPKGAKVALEDLQSTLEDALGEFTPENVNILADNEDSIRYLNFSAVTSGPDRIRTDSDLTYNPGLNLLTLENISATVYDLDSLPPLPPKS